MKVADLVPKGSSDLIKLSWGETEAIPSCVLKGRKRYKLVIMKTVAVGKGHYQLDQSVGHHLVTKGAALNLKGVQNGGCDEQDGHLGY